MNGLWACRHIMFSAGHQHKFEIDAQECEAYLYEAAPAPAPPAQVGVLMLQQ